MGGWGSVAVRRGTVAMVLATTEALAQDSAVTPPTGRSPATGGVTAALGQPGDWLWSVGAASGVRSLHGKSTALAEGRFGVYRELLNPALGVGGIQVEGYNTFD